MKNTQTGFEIAVIGMAGRFPGAKNIAEFWNNLKNGVESITFLSDNELDHHGVDLELRRDPHFVKARGGVLENKDFFDASFFGYSPLEAEVMDPQIRILHECAWEALENAGCNPEIYKGLIGIYCGASANIGWLARSILSGKSEEIGPFEASQLMDKDFISTRLAYKLNLKGPAVFVQTACSTSLAAIHMACRALLMSECDMALAGGVTIINSERNGYLYQEGMIHSPDGHCRAFDAKAKGTITGEGAGIVVLKRLKHAAADRDNIYAMIKGSALNNDGQRKVGYTAPGIDGQTRVIKAALKAAQVTPESISCIEAHGTGTVLGDPIEIEALKRAFNSNKTGFCAIGSVKTNIGHLDAAAGVTGFIKTVLALMNKQIPPSLHFQSPNPEIDFKNSPFYVNNQLKEWQNQEYPLRAGVSSFGIGGTNAHVILEEAPGVEKEVEKSSNTRKWQLIVLSARTGTALDTMTANLAGYLKQHPDVNSADAAYTLQVGRKRFPYRQIIVGADRDDITNGLTSKDPAKCLSHFSHDENPPVVFMFPGQGSQYVHMGLELYQAEPVFRMEMDRCFAILASLNRPGIKEILYPSDLASAGSSALGSSVPEPIDQTGITQPLVFVFEYSLAKLLLKWGITPYAMIGHSIGEYVAACLAGVISLEDALKLVTLRGDLMQKLPGGSMLSVDLPEAELIPLLETETNLSLADLSLAAVNSSSHCVISGTHEAVETVAQKLTANGHRCRKLHTSHAFHSPMMDPVLDEFEKHVKQVPLSKPSLPYLSNVTGNWITAAEAVEPAYWAKHIRAAVRFEKGLQVLLKEDKAIFLEVGPGNVLSTFVRNHQDKREQCILNLIGHPLEKIPADYYLLTKIAQLWMYGVTIDWDGFYADEKRNRVPLPAYPFESLCYSSEFKLEKFNPNDLNKKAAPGKQKNITDWFYIPTWKRSIVSEPGEPPPPTGAEPKPAHVLLFADNLGWGNRLTGELTEKGWDVTIVKAGTTYSKQHDHEFIMNPGDRHHYTTLFDELFTFGKQPGLIVHLWTLTGGNNDNNESQISNEIASEEVRNLQDLGFYSQLYIGGEIKRRVSDSDTRMIVISDNIHPVTGDENLCPGKATLLGPVRVIPQEYSLIKYKCIDIVVPSRDLLKERLRQQLIMEITTCMNDNPGEIIAYRNGRRWVQTYEPIKLNEKNQASTRLREKGVYVITGGLGHIGLILAEYLARQVRARLILIGRSVFPPRHEWEDWLAGENKPSSTREKILKLKEIERLGGAVSVFSADVANREQMQELFAEVEEKTGTINGVIHAAGQLTGKSKQCPFEDITKVEGEEQFKSKVYGLINLEKILRDTYDKRDKTLDFCMLTSSLSGILGGLGFAAYAAAGSFMDAFAHCQLKKSSFNWLSVDWDGWETGENVPILKDGPILPLEGVQAFHRLLEWNEESQVIVSTRDLNTRIRQWIHLQPAEEAAAVPTGNKALPARYSRPNISSTYVSPRNKVEEWIAQTWQDFFRFEKIGVLDNFFELGGDSLKLVTLTAKIRKQSNIDIPLSEFYADPTVAGTAKYLANHHRPSDLPDIEPVEKKEYYPTSSAQNRLYFINRMFPEDIHYNIYQFFIIAGKPGKEKIQHIFQKLIARHEAFRTALKFIDNRVVQFVYDRVDFAVDDFQADESQIETIMNRFIRPFDLERAPFLRVGLVDIGKNKDLFMIDMHHIISDLISSNIIVAEFHRLYLEKELLPLHVQYKDYAAWEPRFFQSEAYKKQGKYWLDTLSGPLPVLALPTDYPRPSQPLTKGKSIHFQLPEEFYPGVKDIMSQYETTPYMTLLAFFIILLSKYTGQTDIIVGSPTAGRPHADLEHIIGFFVNILPVRIQIDPRQRFSEFLKGIRLQVIQVFENQAFQFDELVRLLDIKRKEGRNPLYDVVFAVLSGETVQVEENIGIRFENVYHDDNTAQSDLRFGVSVTDSSFFMRLTYAEQLFKPETAARIKDSFLEIIAQVLENHDIEIEKITLIDAITLTKFKEREENIEFEF